MKNIILRIKSAVTITALCLGCTQDFDEINTNPSVVTEPNVRFLFTYAENSLVSYTGTEWVWEYMEHLLRYTQHLSSDPYELSINVNTRYPAFYRNILPNLEEIRRQIDEREDADRYQNMKMLTYIVQVLQAMKVSDMNGSIPYSEASLARYEDKYDPAYDSQQALFSTWLQQLNEAIAVLSANLDTDQESYANADLFYQSDWTKWVKLANTLKLRLAVRWENQDPSQTAQILQSVMQDPIGPIDSEEAQMVYSNENFSPFGIGGEIDYRSRRYATQTIISFLKDTRDPRLTIYFDPNDLQGSYQDSLDAYGVSLPEFIDPADPLIQYQGGPADWSVEPEKAAYYSNALPVGTSRYFLMSTINRKFFSPKLNSATGIFTQVLVSYAETCFYMAELLAKGYGSGDIQEWYQKGIGASIRTMNMIADDAGSTTAFSDEGTAEIEAYLQQPAIQLDGTNDLERIYIQEYLNFYRQPNEAFVFCRRTGYPRFGSDYYPRETMNQIIPRRFWLDDPGEVNRTNWENAMVEQAFTPRSQDVQDLSSERVWYDKQAPEFGQGQ